MFSLALHTGEPIDRQTLIALTEGRIILDGQASLPVEPPRSGMQRYSYTLERIAPLLVQGLSDAAT